MSPTREKASRTEEITMPPQTCSLYSQNTRKYCHHEIRMYGDKDGARTYYCDKHGRERGAKDLNAADAARAEAERDANEQVPPGERIDSAGAARLYVEAFTAGAKFADERREQIQRAPVT